ncbi:MAG: NAD(P)H-binding protein [Acidobacteriota bacterium]
MPEPRSIVMMGATGAVGGHVVRTLLTMPDIERLTLLGRRPVEGLDDARVAQHTVAQHIVDIFEPGTYTPWLTGHQIAICTLGVGQPSKMSKEEFVRIDRDAVLDFGSACREAGVRHFELLSSVGAGSRSASFYLRTKGELEDGLEALGFERLSLFRPSMILTPTNRYGLSQAITLKVWPLLKPVLLGPLQKFRGIAVERLGAAIARNLEHAGPAVEKLQWRDFIRLTA